MFLGGMLGGGAGRSLQQLADRFLFEGTPPATSDEAADEILDSMFAGGLQSFGAGAPRAVSIARRDAAEKLRKQAVEQYYKAIAPTKESTKHIAQKRVPEMLERRITAKSPQALRERASTEASRATTKLEEIYEALPADRRSPTAPMLRALRDYRRQFQDIVPIEAAEYAALKKAGGRVGRRGQEYVKIIDIDEHAVAAAEQMMSTIAQYGKEISPRSMRRVRQIFDASVARAGGYEGKGLAEGSVVEARKEAAKAIRNQLARDNPELIKVNAEVSFWLDVQKIARETARRRVGQEGGLGVRMAQHTGQVIGAGAGYAAGGGIVGAGLGGFAGGELFKRLARVTQSTKWRTVSATWKARLADALAEGDFQRALGQIAYIEKSVGRRVSQPPPINVPQPPPAIQFRPMPTALPAGPPPPRALGPGNIAPVNPPTSAKPIGLSPASLPEGPIGPRARSIVVRDPKTGRMKRVFTSEAQQ
jgi:hypothetical protein